MITRMDGARRNGLMEAHIRDSSGWEKSTERESSHGRMEVIIKGGSRKMHYGERANIYGRMEGFIKANG